MNDATTMSPALSNYLLAQRLRPARRNRYRRPAAWRGIAASAVLASFGGLGTILPVVAASALHADKAATEDARWQAVTDAAAHSRKTRQASARVIDFAAGRVDTLDEADLMDASPAAVRAAVDSGRLD